MPGKVFFSVTTSLDGFIAPHSAPGDLDALRRGETTPNLERWMAQWSRLQAWVFPQRFFVESQHLGTGGHPPTDPRRGTIKRHPCPLCGQQFHDRRGLTGSGPAPASIARPARSSACSTAVGSCAAQHGDHRRAGPTAAL